jgi:[ribosomal protein S18]-alanine N-acetyltransferase
VMAFREMVEADLDSVLANELRAYAYPWTRGNFVDCLRERKDCRVAELDGRIIGHGVLAVAVGEAHILNVCIARDRQGHGYGRALVAHLLERARVLGAEMVFLEVRPSNRAALDLYESMGFNAIGIRRNYYPAPFGHEDAQVMALDMRSEFATGAL